MGRRARRCAQPSSRGSQKVLKGNRERERGLHFAKHIAFKLRLASVWQAELECVQHFSLNLFSDACCQGNGSKDRPLIWIVMATTRDLAGKLGTYIANSPLVPDTVDSSCQLCLSSAGN